MGTGHRPLRKESTVRVVIVLDLGVLYTKATLFTLNK